MFLVEVWFDLRDATAKRLRMGDLGIAVVAATAAHFRLLLLLLPPLSHRPLFVLGGILAEIF